MNANETIDSFEVLKRYRYLRVVDVCDALDGIGYFDIGLMDASIRSLWSGMKFWGVAGALPYHSLCPCQPSDVASEYHRGNRQRSRALVC